MFGSENWSVWATDGPLRTFSLPNPESTGPRAARTRLESSVRHLGPIFGPSAQKCEGFPTLLNKKISPAGLGLSACSQIAGVPILGRERFLTSGQREKKMLQLGKGGAASRASGARGGRRRAHARGAVAPRTHLSERFL